jgi:hypothetical protein
LLGSSLCAPMEVLFEAVFSVDPLWLNWPSWGRQIVQRSVVELVRWSEVSWLMSDLVSWQFSSWKPVTSAQELQWQPARTWSCVHGSWQIYGVGSHYQTMIGEDTADREDLVQWTAECVN